MRCNVTHLVAVVGVIPCGNRQGVLGGWDKVLCVGHAKGLVDHGAHKRFKVARLVQARLGSGVGIGTRREQGSLADETVCCHDSAHHVLHGDEGEIAVDPLRASGVLQWLSQQ